MMLKVSQGLDQNDIFVLLYVTISRVSLWHYFALFQVVFEEPLPAPFSDILKKHNNDVMNVYRNYVHTVCEYADRREDSTTQSVLPLSEVGKLTIYN